MELRHLRYFIAVAEESTFVAAATRLHLAQPALTRQIHDLEREIGVALFDRGPRGSTLTPAGEVCLTTARHILHELEEAMEQARGSSQGVAGRCVVCVGTRGLSSGLIARIMDRVHSEFPGIDLAVMDGVGHQQWRAIQHYEADIGIGLPSPMAYSSLVTDTFDHDILDAIIVSRSHPLASREEVCLEDLRGDTMLTFKSETAAEFDRLLRMEMKRVGFKPKHRREFDELVSLYAMVHAGQGWMLMGRGLAGFSTPGTVIIPLTDFRVPLAHSIISRSSEQRPVVRTVMDIIRRIAAEDRQATGRSPMGAPMPAVRTDDDSIESSPSAASLIELRHLRYFCAVVDAKSFGRAAERLDLTQPALSRQIRDLERAVGFQLLDRAARGVTTTAGGESFYRSARRILDEAFAVRAEAHRAERGVQSHCVVAAVPTYEARSLVTELVQRCLVDMPNMELSFQEFATPLQPAELRAARIDIGICHASPLSPVEARGLRRQRIRDDFVNCALVPATHPLAARSTITLDDLRGVPFLFMARPFQPGLFDQIYGAFASEGFAPRVENTYEGLKTVWTLVAQGRGWGIAFESQRTAPPQGTVAVPVENFSVPWGLDVISRISESRTSILLVLETLLAISRPELLPAQSA